MDLYFRKHGNGKDIIILHGLFGSSDNWMSIGKVLSEDFTVWALDQRNHGQSPHSEKFDYEIMAEDLNEFIDKHQINIPNIIGHSMGGKVAMNFASKYPKKLDKLIVADIAPKYYPPHHQSILKGLNSVNLESISSRKEIDEILKKDIPEFGVRAFLMKNIFRTEEGNYGWRINLPVLTKKVNQEGEDQSEKVSFQGKCLFIRGENSNYILDEDFEPIKKAFPNATISTLKNAGHWLHAEQPEAFLDLVKNFF